MERRCVGMTELKKCPFCGGEAELYMKEDVCFLCCSECDCQARQCETEEEAIEAWNTRKPIDKVVEQLEDIQNFEMQTGKGYCPDRKTECRYMNSDLGCGYCAFDKAIEIVKGENNG